MATAVYISGESIIVMEGQGDKAHISVQRIVGEAFPVGGLSGGRVVDAAKLTAQLRSFWEKHKLPARKVFLVLNGPRIYTRLVRFPLVSEKKLRELLELEFAADEQLRDAVYDYRILASDSQTHMADCLALAAEAEDLEQYARAFAGAGIALSGIGSVIDSQMRILRMLSCVQGENAIIQTAQENSLISMLLLEGTPIHFHVSRILSERGTPEFASEIGRNANTLMQYFRTLYKQQVVTQAYYGGLYAQEEPLCREVLANLGLTAAPVEAEKRIAMPEKAELAGMPGRRSDTPVIGDYLILAGALAASETGRGQGNLYEQMRKKRLAEKSGRRKLLYPYLAVLLAGIVLIGGFLWRRTALQGQVSSYEESLQEELFQRNYENAVQYMEENEQLSVRAQALEELLGQIEGYPFADSALLEQIRGCALQGMELRITGYESETGTLRLSASAKRAEDCAAFVQALHGTARFGEISYNGYSRTERDAYTFTVECILAAQGTEPGEEE